MLVLLIYSVCWYQKRLKSFSHILNCRFVLCLFFFCFFCRKGKKSSLAKILFRIHWMDNLFYGFVAFCEEMIKVIQPLFLAGLIRYFAHESTVSVTQACLFAFGIPVACCAMPNNFIHIWQDLQVINPIKFSPKGLAMCSILLICTHHIFYFGLGRIGMAMKVSCSALVYKKALRYGAWQTDRQTDRQTERQTRCFFLAFF